MGAYTIIVCNDCKTFDEFAHLQNWKLGKEIISENRKEWLLKHKDHDVVIMSDAHGQFSAEDWDYDKKCWSDKFWKEHTWG